MSFPKIKYIVIVLETKRILCEYKEEEIHNIQKVIRNVLDNNVKLNEISSLTYDNKYTIFYKNDGLITVLCASDINYPNTTGYEFVNEILSKFRTEYKEEEIREAYSYSYNNSFKKIIKDRLGFYNENLDSKDVTSLDRLKDSLLDMKNNLVETVQMLNVRENELYHNVEKAEDLKEKTDELLINARKVKKKEKGNNPYKRLIQIILLGVIIYSILSIICGGFKMPNCSI